MLLELDTGGNVRLEEGKSTDAWFRNCAELVGSRFVPEEYWNTGITGIEVSCIFSPRKKLLPRSTV